MRKLLLIFLLLFSLNVYAGQSIQPVITSGTVAANGILISAVNGTAFIDVDTSKTGASDFSTAILAAVANNDYIVIQSKTSGQIIAGFAKAAGSGTLGTDNIDTDLLADLDITSIGWTAIGGCTVNDANTYTATGSSAGVRKSLFVLGALYKGSVSLNVTGTYSYCYIGRQPSDIIYNGNTGYITASNDMNFYIATVGGVSGTVTDILSATLQKILLPSSAGITITNSPGGSTYNFSLLPVTKTTFYNDANGYTYRIISRHYYGTLIASASVDDDDTTIVTTDGSAACDLSTTLNLSTYVGASGATKYILVLEDGAGKVARGHIGEVISGTNVKIYSAKNGSTQNWELIESGFNASADPMTVRIYRDL